MVCQEHGVRNMVVYHVNMVVCHVNMVVCHVNMVVCQEHGGVSGTWWCVM